MTPIPRVWEPMAYSKGLPDPVKLVTRIRSGDTRAENDLVTAYGRGVRLKLKWECRDEAAMDDLFQETFRIAIEKIRNGDLKRAESLGSFLAGIAKNSAIEFYRNEGRLSAELPASASAPPQENPLQQLMRKEMAAMVRVALAGLPTKRDREILYRFYLGGEDRNLICKDLGLSEIHFNRVLYRAKQRFRELWQRTAARSRMFSVAGDP